MAMKMNTDLIWLEREGKLRAAYMVVTHKE